MGVEHVPTLYVNDTYQKLFLTGKDAIRRYLITCTQTETSVTGTTDRKATSGRTSNRTKAGETGPPLDFFNQQGIIPPISGPDPGEGMCKETEICK
jgi:hypothetical protein